MKRRVMARLSPHADLVVIYPGHRPHPNEANKPTCVPIKTAGVLVKTKSAEESGLVRCPSCRRKDGK